MRSSGHRTEWRLSDTDANVLLDHNLTRRATEQNGGYLTPAVMLRPRRCCIVGPPNRMAVTHLTT